MVLIVMPSLLSKRPRARIRARCEASFFIVLSKSARCCSVRGRTYLTLIALEMGFTYHIVLEVEREIFYQKTFVRALPGLRPCYLHCAARVRPVTLAPTLSTLSRRIGTARNSFMYSSLSLTNTVRGAAHVLTVY